MIYTVYSILWALVGVAWLSIMFRADSSNWDEKKPTRSVAYFVVMRACFFAFSVLALHTSWLLWSGSR